MANRLACRFNALLLVVGVALLGATPARAETAADAFDQGEAAREEMRFGDAAQAYWRAVTLDPGYYRAHVRFQDASLASGTELDSLTADYELLERDFPAHAAAIHLHALRLKPPAERVPLVEALLKQGDSSDGHLELGRAKLALGDASGAVKELQKALATAPGAGNPF